MSLNNDRSVALYESLRDTPERVFECWHASSIAMCPRAHYYKRLGVPEVAEPMTGAKKLRLQAGHALEGVIREHIVKVYGETWSNLRYTSSTYQLTGEFDNYVLVQGRLVEIKSVHDKAFFDDENLTGLKEYVGRGQFKLKTTPYLQHELQNHAYVMLLHELGMVVTGIDYVYISLSGRIVVYSTEVQEDLLKNVEKRLAVLNEAWEKQEPPACICKPTHPLYGGAMQYCPYKRTKFGTPDRNCCPLKLIEKEQ